MVSSASKYIFTSATDTINWGTTTTGSIVNANLSSMWYTPTILSQPKIAPKDFYKRLTIETKEWLKDVLVY